MAKYRLLPVEVDAYRLDGDVQPPAWLWGALAAGRIATSINPLAISVRTADNQEQKALEGSWIVRTANGDLSVCDDTAFNAAYEPAIVVQN